MLNEARPLDCELLHATRHDRRLPSPGDVTQSSMQRMGGKRKHRALEFRLGSFTNHDLLLFLNGFGPFSVLQASLLPTLPRQLQSQNGSIKYRLTLFRGLVPSDILPLLLHSPQGSSGRRDSNFDTFIAPTLYYLLLLLSPLSLSLTCFPSSI